MYAPLDMAAGATRTDASFFSRNAALLDVLLRVGDLLIIVLAGWATYALRFASLDMAEPYRLSVILTVLLTLVIFPSADVYRSWRGGGLATEIIHVWFAWVVVLATLFVLEWLLKSTATYSRLWMLGWFGAGLILFAIHRVVARCLLRAIRVRGIDRRRVLLVGATHAGEKIVEAIRSNPWTGFDVAGYVRTPHDEVQIDGLPCLATMEELAARGDTLGCEQLWIALPMSAEAEIRRITHAFDDSPATIRLIPDLFGYELLNQRATELAGIPVITLRGSRVTGYAGVAKVIEDRVLSAIILACISPLMVLLALGVKLSSPGPVLFKQKRHGLGGREVEVWKFRSMRVHEEPDGVVTQATRNDVRTTRFGRFLRRTSLDELPQFINVLLGDMSIVGPRPHAVEHDFYYRGLVRDYFQRNSVKPGITGWAQVNGLRGETDTVEKMAARVEYDLAYIRNWSIWLDLKIILRTIIQGFIGKNAY